MYVTVTVKQTYIHYKFATKLQQIDITQILLITLCQKQNKQYYDITQHEKHFL